MKRLLLITVIGMSLTACTTTKVVTVPEIHTEYVHTTDSVHHTDSVIMERETVVMQLDSEAMAAYGIRLEAAERAWMVKTKELERALQRIQSTKSDTVIKIDSIPYPVEVPVEVAKPLTWWQKTRMHGGEVLMGLMGIMGVWGFVKLKKKLWPL